MINNNNIRFTGLVNSCIGLQYEKPRKAPVSFKGLGNCGAGLKYENPNNYAKNTKGKLNFFA